MNKTETMNWKTFKDTLLQHPDHDLQFQYADDKLVNPAYHITEIKLTPITSVDCGGVMNKWTEIIVQLWIPDGEEQARSMKVSKALSIIGIVESLLPLDTDGIVKIEFGNSEFDTRQMLPAEIIADAGSLTFDLRPDAVQCKAIERGGSCGTNPKGEECCTPTAEKPKIKLINLTTPAEACCTPGGGCC